jgi:ABC-type multidrug transport system ATPase subunit
MSAIIQVKNLSKDFKELKAVDDLSFTVEKGQVYGFLGQNGAGKSTTIRMLLTLVRPTNGHIEMFGMNLQTHRREILQQTGAVIERPDLYKYLSALENIRIFSRLSGEKKTDAQLMAQLEQVDLAGRAHSRVKTYSQGMKQRLGLACALVHDPQLLILDEPTNGLDPQGIADMRNMIIRLSREMGKTVLVSSHLLSEMEMMADSLLIINKGRKVVEGKMNVLLNPVSAVVELVSTDMKAALYYLENSEWKAAMQPWVNGAIRLEVEKARIPELHRQLVQNNIPVLSLRPLHSLEDYFLSQTNA